jgi:uncharacterized protein
MQPTLSAPVEQKERLPIIDIVRGFALLGILMMNIPFFSSPFQYADNPTLHKNFTGVNYYTWFSVNIFFEGTMRALFTMLFGAGSILLLSRLEAKNNGMAADIFYRRLLWLLFFGMVNAFVFLWFGDILYSYALCGLLIYPFRNMKAKPLFIIGISLLAFTFLKDSYNLYEKKMIRTYGVEAVALEAAKKPLTAEQEMVKGAWMTLQSTKVNKEEMNKAATQSIAMMQQDYVGVWGYLRYINVWIQSTKFYSTFFLDIMCLLFLGMALFKSGVLTAARSKRFYWGLLLAGYGVGLSASYWYLNTKILAGFDPTRVADIAYADVYQIKRFFLCLGHLSALVLLYKYGIAKALLGLLRNVGQMAFTNYLMQSIICVTIFYGFGFGLFGKLQIYQQYYVVGAVWLFQVIFSKIWMHYYRFGPFEWLWRSLTYWKKQPIKRVSSTTGSEEEKGDKTAVPAIV